MGTKLPLCAPVEYVSPFLSDCAPLFERLRDELAWERREDAPRYEYHCNDFGLSYAYGRGRGRRTYEARPYTEAILDIRRRVEAYVGCVLDVCFLNRYAGQHDQLGWHSDDSPEMDDARPIVSVSLGAERVIQFRRKLSYRGRPSAAVHRPVEEAALAERAEVLMASGSLLVMAPRMQDAWEHRIPKTSGAVGERISLVFRGYVPQPEPEAC